MGLLRDDQAAEAVSHPVRVEILKRLARRELSPVQLASKEELDMSIGTIAYHVRILKVLGAIRETRRKQVRGAIQHFYRANVSIKITQRELKS